MKRPADLRRVIPHQLPVDLLLNVALPDAALDYLAADDSAAIRQVTVTIGDGTDRLATRDHIILIRGMVDAPDQPTEDAWPYGGSTDGTGVDWT